MILATGLEGVTTEKAGRNQLMVRSQEQTSFMFLLMHTLPQMKDLKHQYMMRKTEVMIQHNDTPCVSEEVNMEKGGINKKLCMVPHQEQMPG